MSGTFLRQSIRKLRGTYRSAVTSSGCGVGVDGYGIVWGRGIPDLFQPGTLSRPGWWPWHLPGSVRGFPATAETGHGGLISGSTKGIEIKHSSGSVSNFGSIAGVRLLLGPVAR